ncbi:molecular chaperone DnaJ [Salmonella enterica]
MITITKERIELFIKSPLENGLTRGEQMELARIAQASMDAEPVGYFYADKPGDWYQISDGDRVPDHRRIPLYSIPQSGPVVKLPNEFISNEGIVVQIEKVMAVLAVAGIQYERKGNACRAAMLQSFGNSEQLNSPVIPDGYVMVPKRLTAENGAKGVLSGEFSETKFINCPECFGDDECETCDGSGRIEITVPVTWTTIKAVWAKGVELFAAAPQQDKSHG